MLSLLIREIYFQSHMEYLYNILPMDAIIFAVALCESGNHKAANFVGANITKG